MKQFILATFMLLSVFVNAQTDVPKPDQVFLSLYTISELRIINGLRLHVLIDVKKVDYVCNKNYCIALIRAENGLTYLYAPKNGTGKRKAKENLKNGVIDLKPCIFPTDEKERSTNSF